MKYTIKDSEFTGHSRSASLGRENTKYAPIYVKWIRHVIEHARFVTDRHIKEDTGVGKVAWLLEPSALRPENYIAAQEQYYDYVLTHEQKYAKKHKNWLYYPFGGSFIDLEKWSLPEKKKRVSFILSKKNTLAGHKLRHRVHKGCKGLFDVYGQGFNPMDSKRHMLEDYAFSVVIESNKTPGYFTEKIIDCFATGTIPIYWGDPDITTYFLGNGIIPWSGDLEELNRMLNYLRGNWCSTYKKLHKYVKMNQRRAVDFAICEDNIYKMYPEIFK
jgi:hypothetical protein